MKIVTIIGARPQFIKAAAFSRAITGKHEEILVHTGQHFDANMSDVFFKELRIPEPKYNLGISGGTHGKMTGAMLAGIEEVLLEEKPDWVLVYGDTNSTMAGALAAVKLGIQIAHVESGVRMGTLSNPEEVNRVVTDHISQLLFTPTEIEVENLKKEGIKEHVYAVGNIMYDSFLYGSRVPWKREEAEIFDLCGNPIVIPDQYYYLTCHRQGNTFDDQPLLEILRAMNSLELPTIYPVHPRNRERAERLCREYQFEHVVLTQPVGYLESIQLLKHCEKVVTDSGGLQCEAFFAGKQCVTVFDRVIWPQTMVENRNQLARPLASDILKKLGNTQKIDLGYQPFGDGRSAERIIEIMEGESR